MERVFSRETTFEDKRLTLALAPGLGLDGPTAAPSFFHGFATHPQVLARGLVTLADITATRYYNFSPMSERDPILSAHGDRLRAECFSGCNAVYACFEVMSSSLDGGDIGRGTTNVDIGPKSRVMLSNLPRHELLHVDVGTEGLRAATLTTSMAERPVTMPSRWVPALGNAAQSQQGFVEAFRVPASGARRFLAGLPPASASGHSAWLSSSRGAIKVSAVATPGAVLVNGLQRLSALKRLLPHAQGLIVHGPADEHTAGAMITLLLPDARLTLGLTDKEWRGYSGEGSLLASLAEPNVTKDADLVSAILAFEPIIDVHRLTKDTALPEARVKAALAVLAASGRVGWDVNDQAYFHRELPDSPERVEKDNPRLTAAQKLVSAGAVRNAGSDAWIVTSGDAEYGVRLGCDAAIPEKGATCSCTWYLSHGGDRGPCKHVLAVILTQSTSPTERQGLEWQ
ncbi:SWIM zinc finger family protein [Pseudoglutamicibacter cumminsii]|uniref:SWIM zinc finger family protein n=1 Tax=Pseudoglutamicibacter cumminsii TaxID=156979 RepID=UPI0026EC7BAF|nr:SWIM zinc finger family protein [Pseudoglutamicibacter cumminsii]